ncbi:uncharacterized protein LOC108039879 [Drosophila rhopaloa]|uniref:Uncharacterized protein LOC108039879 n=1 Tax=Drosophila rhopaloa TaxID=1041015 RepID=A0A6P4E3P6_DRORH|nr:uncharacterized protein LOC108039879 [Drosophila rhopaloa]
MKVLLTLAILGAVGSLLTPVIAQPKQYEERLLDALRKVQDKPLKCHLLGDLEKKLIVNGKIVPGDPSDAELPRELVKNKYNEKCWTIVEDDKCELAYKLFVCLVRVTGVYFFL